MFLLAILLAGAVSASNNQTDDIKVVFNTTVYEKDLGSIDVDVPENTSGNLKAEINNVEFYNENVSGPVKIPITIPPKAIPLIYPNKITDHTTYNINLFFNNTLLKSNHTLKVMRYTPDYTVQGFKEEFLKDDVDEYASVFFPESANGTLEVFIDGKFAQRLTPSTFTFLNASNFNTLPLGIHNVTLAYSGDEYYRKFNRTFNFSVVDMTIEIPKNVVLEHDDCISAKTIKNTDGIVTVYVDNQAVFKDKLDKYGEFLHSLFNDVTCGEHLVEVQYNASKFNYSKKQLVNISYYVDSFSFGPFTYGAEDNIVFIVPTDFNKDLIDLRVDGEKIDFEIDNSGWIEIDVSKFSVGNHTVDFNFKGDNKYYNCTQQHNFTIGYEIISPYDVFYGGNAVVSLTLPKSANGLLQLYINGKLYREVKLTNGYAQITIGDLTPGEYRYVVKYSGNDFNVTDVNSTLSVSPDILSPGDVYCGEDKYITVKTSKDAKGKVIFNIAGKNITSNIKDGKALLTLKDLKVGDYDIEAYYMADNGFNATLFWFVEIQHSNVKLTNVKVSSDSAKMKVYINGKLARNANVVFKIDKMTKTVKTDKNGVATIKLAPGKHTITAKFGDAKASKTVNVHVIILKTVKVKKSAKKLVLSATLKKGKKYLKNKVVTFKFNGKTYKAKTNKKGVVKVTIKKLTLKKLKVGKKVTYQASYGRDTVKKSVVVKK